ncbi:MAG: hypothetical protein U0359_18690 [Byssovorax sp.]
MPNPVDPSGKKSNQFASPLLQHAAVNRRLTALFKAMASDYLLREQFVTDPAQVLSEYVQGAGVAPGVASVTNQLMYAVMANPKMRSWLNQYSLEHHDEPPPRETFLADFGHAVAQVGDKQLVFALLRSSTESDGNAGFETFEWMVIGLLSILRGAGPVSGPTGGPPTGGPPTGGPPTGGPPTGGPPTGGPPTGGPPTGGPPTGGPPTGGPPTGGPPTGGPPTGGPPTGGPPTGGSAFSHLPDYVSLPIDELVRYAVKLRDRGALDIKGAKTKKIP